MTLDLSPIPTWGIPPLLLLALALAGLAWRRGTTEFKRGGSSPLLALIVLAGGCTVAVAIAAAIEFWLVRA